MANEQTPDPKDGEKLDKILTHLHSLHSKCDALVAKHELLAGRVDAFEKQGSNITPEDQAAAAAERERLDAEERERADKARADANAREQAELPKFVEIQRTVDEIAQAFGDSTGPARWLHGESLGNYTRRLLSKYKCYSRAWKEVDLTQVGDSALGVATAQIRADAIGAAALPEYQEGRLISRESKDKYGRTITKFYGDARVAVAPFTYHGMVRRVRIRDPREIRELQGR